jgi:hypothetical protein
MAHSLALRGGDRRQAVEQLTSFVVKTVETARQVEEPFFHLELERVFPEDVYAAMLAAMPVAADYRPMSGRAKASDTSGGPPTRVKIDLFPEYIRHLPEEKRPVWDMVGRSLRSAEVKAAFVRRLAPALARRFGGSHARIGLYPIPILTRDIAGYRIAPHTDTHWKGITVQLYLPPNLSTAHIGTIFHEQGADGSLPKKARMTFAPNTGYAFAVGSDTWHSVDPVGTEVRTRDSILLTYFVDEGVLRFLRNRGKRLGNVLLNETRAVRRR